MIIFPYETKRFGSCIAVVSRVGNVIRRNRHTVVNFKGKSWSGARLSYCLNVRVILRKPKFGKKARTGLCLHKCNNPWCINPNHLYIGNRSQNQNDFYETNRGKERKKEVSKFMHEAEFQKDPIRIEKVARWHRGKKRSPETCAKIGAKSKDRKKSKASKLKTSSSLVKAWKAGKFKHRRSSSAALIAAWKRRKNSLARTAPK